MQALAENAEQVARVEREKLRVNIKSFHACALLSLFLTVDFPSKTFNSFGPT